MYCIGHDQGVQVVYVPQVKAQACLCPESRLAKQVRVQHRHQDGLLQRRLGRVVADDVVETVFRPHARHDVTGDQCSELPRLFLLHEVLGYSMRIIHCYSDW